MVKRQNEKLYESSRERQANRGTVQRTSHERPLPFSHCALSLTPFEHPVCSRSSSVIFESANLLPYVLEHQKDPVTGDALQSRELITLHMNRDEEQNWSCPVLTKPFSKHTKIVAIIQPNKDNATVYSYEAYHNFNVKTKTYEDLVTGERFDPKKDVLILFDPDNDTNRDINSFYHIRNARKIEKGTNNPNVRQSLTASRILEKMDAKRAEKAAAVFQKAPEELHASVRYLDDDGAPIRVFAKDVTGVSYTNAATTASLTSTAMPRQNSNQERDAIPEEIIQAQLRVVRKLKRKGYVRLFLNCLNEPLVLELHCDIVPRTCANFLGLCRQSAYNGCRFHRLIPSFMIQGGKPTDGLMEESYWGGSFRDEFDDRLKHGLPGVVSMANSGEHTNKRQFFITFKSCTHLDRKHTVFGSVVNDNKAKLLAEIKSIPTGKNDVPRKEIKIVRTEIVEDPVADAVEMERQRLMGLVEKRNPAKGSKVAVAKKDTDAKETVGKYLTLPVTKEKKRPSGLLANCPPVEVKQSVQAVPQPKKPKFGDFSSW